MLRDYILAYNKAKKHGDKKKMQQIEKELASHGMDRYTLGILAGKEQTHDAQNNASAL